jgi:hypothetical protein
MVETWCNSTIAAPTLQCGRRTDVARRDPAAAFTPRSAAAVPQRGRSAKPHQRASQIGEHAARGRRTPLIAPRLRDRVLAEARELYAAGDRLTLELMLDTANRRRGLARQTGRAAFDGDDVAQLAVLHLIHGSARARAG